MDTRERKVQETLEAGGPARWSRAAALGLVFAASAPILMLSAAIASGIPVGEELPFFGGVALLGLVAAALVWRFGAWAKIVGIVAGLLMVMAMFWTAFGLAVPQAFFDFVPGVLVVPGVLFAIVCCVSAIVAGRRGHRTPAAVDGERTAIRVALGVVGGLALISGLITVVSHSSVDAAGAQAKVTMTAFEFEPDTVTVPGGTTIHVRNSDPFLHTFTIDALDIDVELGPRSEALVEIPAEPGEYVFYCVPHTGDAADPGEKDMAGRLRVT